MTKIALNNYNKILSQILEIIDLTKKNITKTVNQEKVLMSWNIGKVIEEYLFEDDRAGYGVQLVDQLEKDLLISRSTLYQMRSFYKIYPKLKSNQITLNWSQYRSLITIKDDKERAHFENLALDNSLNANDLQFEITQQRMHLKEQSEVNKAKKTLKKIHPSRGELFNYKLVKLLDTNKAVIDCGFNILTEIQTNLKAPLLVKSHKDEHGNITLKKSLTSKSKLYTYKAYLEKVVDGDTLRVVLDLGFGIFHKEILRLKGINAAEMSSLQGQDSASALKKILRDVEFLIIKSNRVDIYGRYVADVFFGQEGESLNPLAPNQVASKGIYLNQLLLDKNLAKLF
mgnify:CR=1 FL=1